MLEKTKMLDIEVVYLEPNEAACKVQRVHFQVIVLLVKLFSGFKDHLLFLFN